jgi:hypothetical protein
MSEARHQTSVLVSFLFIAIFVFAYALTVSTPATEAAHLSPTTGWAWSSNVGWISFNCQDITDLCAISNYKVHLEHLDAANTRLRGWAWSSNVGWISFEPNDLSGCPAGLCEARFNGAEFNGWAKVLSNNEFISLNCADLGICGTSNYKLSYDSGTNAVNGYAYGSNVVGWVSFNCQNTGTCATSNYAVYIQPAPEDSCQDISALNFGLPLPCTYAPAGTSTPPIIKGEETTPR